MKPARIDGAKGPTVEGVEPIKNLDRTLNYWPGGMGFWSQQLRGFAAALIEGSDCHVPLATDELTSIGASLYRIADRIDEAGTDLKAAGLSVALVSWSRWGGVLARAADDQEFCEAAGALADALRTLPPASVSELGAVAAEMVHEQGPGQSAATGPILQMVRDQPELVETP